MTQSCKVSLPREHSIRVDCFIPRMCKNGCKTNCGEDKRFYEKDVPINTTH